MIYVNLQCLQRRFHGGTGFKFFPSWANYRRVTAIIKMIKTQSELNPNYFPMGSLGEEIHLNRN